MEINKKPFVIYLVKKLKSNYFRKYILSEELLEKRLLYKKKNHFMFD